MCSQEPSTSGRSEPDFPAQHPGFNNQAHSHVLRFRHICQSSACPSPSCSLCKNNPNKRCADNCNFGSVYVQGNKIKAKCGSEIFVELLSKATGQAQMLSDVKLQLSVIDGSPRHSAKMGLQGSLLDHAKELLISDQGQQLLRANLELCRGDGHGRLLVDFQGSSCRLPEVHINEKTDMFRVEGRTFSSFRLLARAVAYSADGQLALLPHVAPALSSEFTVKSARAVHEFLKPEYLHYKESVTKLKYVGGATAACLIDIQTHIPELPMTSVQTVEQLAKLIRFTDQHQHLQNKLMNLMKTKGIQQQKWNYLRNFLATSLVFDDDTQRAFFPDASKTQGLLFNCRQGQVNMHEPVGLVERVCSSSRTVLVVSQPNDPQQMQHVHRLKSLAAEAWSLPGHPGWSLVLEPVETLAHGSGPRVPSPRAGNADSMSITTPWQAMARQAEQARASPRHSASFPPPPLQVLSMQQAMPAQPSPSLTVTSSSPQDMYHQHSLNVAWQRGVLAPGPVMSPFGCTSYDSVVGAGSPRADRLQLSNRAESRFLQPPGTDHWDMPRHSSSGLVGGAGGDEEYGPSRLRVCSSPGMLAPQKPLQKVAQAKSPSPNALMLNHQEVLEALEGQLQSTGGEGMAVDGDSGGAGVGAGGWVGAAAGPKLTGSPFFMTAGKPQQAPVLLPHLQQQQALGLLPPLQQQQVMRMSDNSSISVASASNQPQVGAAARLAGLRTPHAPAEQRQHQTMMHRRSATATALPQQECMPAALPTSLTMDAHSSKGLVVGAGGGWGGSGADALQLMPSPAHADGITGGLGGEAAWASFVQLQVQEQGWAAAGQMQQQHHLSQQLLQQQQHLSQQLLQQQQQQLQQQQQQLQQTSEQRMLLLPQQHQQAMPTNQAAVTLAPTTLSLGARSLSASSGSGGGQQQQYAVEEATGETGPEADTWEMLLDTVWGPELEGEGEDLIPQ